MNQEFWRKFFCAENKKSIGGLMTLLVLGVVLLFCSNSFFVGEEQKEIVNKEQVQSEIREETDLEKKLEEILSQVTGVGMVRVMITYQQSESQIVAMEQTQSEQTVVLMQTEQGEQPLILSEQAPQVEGVVIVAQGATNAVVKDALHQAAQAVLTVPSHKIAILPMK